MPSDRTFTQHGYWRIMCVRSVFLLAYGVMPDSEGRGYVLRRIIRRALRYEYHLLADDVGKDSILLPLVDVLVAEMASSYPIVVQQHKQITAQLGLERERFFSNSRAWHADFSQHECFVASRRTVGWENGVYAL